jgi:hypothetical protein
MEVLSKTVYEQLKSLGVPIKPHIRTEFLTEDEKAKDIVRAQGGELIDYSEEALIDYKEEDFGKMRSVVSLPYKMFTAMLEIGRHGKLHIIDYKDKTRYKMEVIAQRNVKKIEKVMKTLNIEEDT